jgi:drug/metabolite transporter (DMT)-like permease
VIAAGIAAAAAASVANAFAIVLQAAEDRRAPLSRTGRFSLLTLLATRPRWLAGTGLMVLAWPLQIVALGLAPITVVQPALASTQLVLLALARLKLGERIGRPEVLGALAILLGVTAVIVAAPRHLARDPAAPRLAVPLAVVGVAVVVAYACGRRGARGGLWLVVGAGLAYAWVDFANKLLANDISGRRWGVAVVWLACTIAVGAVAFLQETSALQRRPSVTVAPVVGAIQDSLPVLMALWSGAEVWRSGARNLLPLVLGVALVTVGAVLLGRSRAVARAVGDGVAATAAAARESRRGRCG